MAEKNPISAGKLIAIGWDWLPKRVAYAIPGPPTWEPGQANQMYFFPTKGIHYKQKYSSVLSAVQVTGLRRSHRWRRWMWSSWAGMVTRDLLLWGRLDVLTNSVKRRWRWLMVENYLATPLVDIPAVSIPIAHPFKTSYICGIVLFDKTAHFRVVFYCTQHKVHLCNDHAILIRFLIYHTCQVDGLSWQRRNAH